MSKLPEEEFGLVLAAAGTGSRFGSAAPKQFWELRGKPLYLYALEPFLDFVVEVVLVIPGSWKDRISAQIRSLSFRTPVHLEQGGLTRQESVFRGLERLTSSTRFVLVHDAARPRISPTLIESVMRSTREWGACVPVVPMRDTVKVVEDNVVVHTVDRSSLYLTQTPQGFELELLRRAFAEARRKGFQGTDEASLVETLGEDVHVVDGEPSNVKVTWPEDLKPVLGFESDGGWPLR